MTTTAVRSVDDGADAFDARVKTRRRIVHADGVAEEATRRAIARPHSEASSSPMGELASERETLLGKVRAREREKARAMR